MVLLAFNASANDFVLSSLGSGNMISESIFDMGIFEIKIVKIWGRKSEDGKQKTENKRRKTEDGKRKIEDGGRRIEDG